MREIKKIRMGACALLAAALLISCQESFDKRLQREAREFTENHCPLEPEPGTRLDSTVYCPQTRTYKTYYSLSPESEQAVQQDWELFRQLLLRQLVADVDHKALKDERVNFGYVYHSQTSGKLVRETLIKPDEYLRD